MNLSPNQIVDLVADATDKPNSIRYSLYAKAQRGDLPPRATEPSARDGHPAIYFNIEDACALKLLYELGRIGFAAGTPVHAAAIFAMRNWSPIRPQVANYENPLQWAMAHVQSGGDVALAIYSARQGEKLGILVKITGSVAFESAPTPAFAELPVSEATGNLEGKELRLGATTGPLWAVLTTSTSNGSVGAMHDSLNPLTGLMPMAGMWLNATFGGVGVGMINMFLYIVVAVFVAGMMVGRTPEYLGHKIEAKEVRFWDLFKPVRNKKDMEQFEQHLADESLRHEFYARLKAFSRCLHISLSSDKLFDVFDEAKVDALKRDTGRQGRR